MFIVYRLNWLD